MSLAKLHGSGVNDSTAERDLLERIKNNLTKIRHDRLSRKRPFETLGEEFEALTERSSYPCGLQSGGGTHDSFSFVRLSRWLASWVGGLAVFTSVSLPPLLPPSLQLLPRFPKIDQIGLMYVGVPADPPDIFFLLVGGPLVQPACQGGRAARLQYTWFWSLVGAEINPFEKCKKRVFWPALGSPEARLTVL